MKLAIVADAFDPANGWGRYAGELARGLIAAGADVRLVSPRRYCRMDDLGRHPDSFDIPSFQHETRHFAKLLARSIRPLRRALRGVDLVHCMVEPYAPAVALAAGRRPYVVSLVGTYALPSGRHRIEAWLLRWALRRARSLTAISSYTESKVRDETGLANTSVVPLGVNAAEFAAPDPPPTRDRSLVLSVGEVKPRKGIDLVVKAIAQLRPEIEDLHYVVVGPYDAKSRYVGELRSSIATLGLTDHVSLTGAVSHDELVTWYHRAGVVAMPYRDAGRDFEGFGLVLLEAGAAGVPVISARHSGAEEPVRDGANGLLVAPDDVDALGHALRRLLSDDSHWRRLAAGGRQRARTMTWRQSTERLLDVYAHVVGNPLARPASDR